MQYLHFKISFVLNVLTLVYYLKKSITVYLMDNKVVSDILTNLIMRL
jgi:hypothetical protein